MNNRILVIDDDKSIRKSMELTFEDTEFTLKTAESGMFGLEEIKKQKYDLILLDLKMPGMDGVDTLHEIRKIAPDVKIYIITAFHREYFDRLEEAEKMGLDFEVAQKPIFSEDLICLVKGIFLEGEKSV